MRLSGDHSETKLNGNGLVDSRPAALSMPLASVVSPLDVVNIVKRQFWLICACVSVCVALAVTYWMRAETWYESTAKILVNQRDPGLAVTSSQSTRSTKDEEVVNEDVLANHMEIIRSRRIIESALQKHELVGLPSIVSRLKPDEDEVEFINDHLDMQRGGEGSAKSARSLNIAFRHTDPDDAQKILQAIIIEYEQFLGQQLKQVMSKADSLIREAQVKIEKDLKQAQEEYVRARRQAPVLFQGEGSGNAFVEKYRRLQEELVDIEIQESSTRTRLEKVLEALKNRTGSAETDLDLLALIDNDSLTRLGSFAMLQMNSSQSPEFLMRQPTRLEEARTEYSGLLALKTEEQKKRADFGPQHPNVVQLQEQIKLVESFIADQKNKTELPWTVEQLSPSKLLDAYVGFLRHDLGALDEKKKGLLTSSQEAEEQAKELTEFELRDESLRQEIDRKQQLFDGIVNQLRDMDTASGLSGYIQELLESPRRGSPVWPDLKICGAGGVVLGLLFGLLLAVVNDRIDGRFRSATDVDQSINLPVLGRVGKLRRGQSSSVSAIVCDELTPEGEVFRLIRTVLQGSVKTGRLRTISVTSPMSKDGKSSITANLAACFAQSGISVLLIDADMRRPTSHRIFGLPVANGLSDVLDGGMELDQAVHKSKFGNLSLMTAGRAVSHPAELLQSSNFDELLTQLKEQFQLVMVDTGPILSVSDAAVVAQKTDGMLLVVRPSNGTKEQAQDAVSRLRAVGANLLGCVLNTYGSGKEFASAGGYYGYYASEYKMDARDRDGRENVVSNGKAKHVVHR